MSSSKERKTSMRARHSGQAMELAPAPLPKELGDYLRQSGVWRARYGGSESDRQTLASNPKPAGTKASHSGQTTKSVPEPGFDALQREAADYAQTAGVLSAGGLPTQPSSAKPARAKPSSAKPARAKLASAKPSGTKSPALGNLAQSRQPTSSLARSCRRRRLPGILA